MVSVGRTTDYGLGMTIDDLKFLLGFGLPVAAIVYFFVKSKSYFYFLFGLIVLGLPSLVIGAFSAGAGLVFYFGGAIAIGLYFSSQDGKR